MIAKHVPPSRQHLTAGPYSPVLEIAASRLIVISGQAAIDPTGAIITDDFLGQARATLDNCLTQLQAAECSFADVFKVNVFLADLGNWSAFNDIYQSIVPEPRPVRTTVQAGLLPGLLIEIEMWAAKA